MSYLIVSEAALRDADIERHLAGFDRTRPVRVIVPVRELTEDEQQFVAIEFDESAATPEVQLATWRLEQEIDTLTRAGFVDVAGEVCPTSLDDVVESAAESGDVDVVVAVTPPTGVAGWLHLDLAHRLERHLDEPVVHIELEAAAG